MRPIGEKKRMHSSPRHGGSFAGFLLALIVGVAIGLAGYYLFLREPLDPTPTKDEPSTATTGGEPPVPAAPADESYIARKIREWKLTPEDLKHDLATAGRVVREKSRQLGDKVKDATSDVAIIAKIKAKYAIDDHLQALKITVGCEEGRVTLSGTVAAPDLIGRAVVLALDTEGVVDVVSTLKVVERAD
jgi:hypothetical protein